MTRERRPRTASSTTFERCGCGCGLAFIVLRDKKGDAFAIAGLREDDWPRFVADGLERETATERANVAQVFH